MSQPPNHISIGSAVFAQYISVTNAQTDKQTDIQTTLRVTYVTGFLHATQQTVL